MASEAEGCWFDPSQSHHVSPTEFLIYRRAVSYGIYGGVLWSPRAGLPSSVRSRSGQRCSPSINGRLARPCDRSTYTYMSSGRSPAQLATPCFGPPRCGPDRDRAWQLWSSSSRSGAPRPRSRSPRRLSRRLHGVTRRHASSAEYRLLALRRVPPRIRRTEPSRVAQLATRHAVPLPHYMLNPFKRSQQQLIDSIAAGK